MLARAWTPLLCLSTLLTIACDSGGEGKNNANSGKPAAKAPAKPAVSRVSPAAVLDRVKPLMGPLPAQATTDDNPLTDEKIALGRTLYYETRLSKNHDVSCNTCHDLQNYGIDVRTDESGDRIATSMGHKKAFGERNSPTVYNAAFHLAQFWDGRAADVEEQAKGPILNPVEMAMPSEAHVIKTLKSMPAYVEMFKAAFPDDNDPINYDNMAKAIGAFERKLVTPSRFDEFLSGKMVALKQDELRGLELFLDVGCITCHGGSTLGGTQYQKLGSVKPWPDLEDKGRGAITGNAADDFVFKVPSLRNVTKTAPYLHDGSFDELDVMVAKMAEHQSARGALKPEEVDDIVAFLGALEGEIPSEYIKKPELPPSGPNTPEPDAS